MSNNKKSTEELENIIRDLKAQKLELISMLEHYAKHETWCAVQISERGCHCGLYNVQAKYNLK